jgi:hypothetical protein
MAKFSQKKILFYPEPPVRHTVIFKIIQNLNLDIVHTLGDIYDVGIYWEDTTFRSGIVKWRTDHIINKHSIDISKRYLGECYTEVFGRVLNIDPQKRIGSYLRKSNLNAVKDGQVIVCPVINNERYVYQVLINNIAESNTAVDFRVPIFGETIPIVFRKTRTLNKRFSDDFDEAKICETFSIFTTEEIKSILRFCKEVGLDYGELDILRDQDSNSIFIVDANNTPWGPPEELSNKETQYIVDLFSQCFEQVFLK